MLPNGYVAFAATDLTDAAKAGLVDVLGRQKAIDEANKATMSRTRCKYRGPFRRMGFMNAEEIQERLDNYQSHICQEDGHFKLDKTHEARFLEHAQLKRAVRIFESLDDHETMIDLATYELLQPWLRPDDEEGETS